MDRRDGKFDFEHTMLPHLDAAYNLARWIVTDASLAEDVVQDACERALKYYGSFRGGSGRAWLLQIVRNSACTALAIQRRRMEVPLTDPDGGDENAGYRDVIDPN